MVIDPTEKFAVFELERVKWFLGALDLTKNEEAGNEIQTAYTSVAAAIMCLQKKRKKLD